jgi:hypothetical protein
MIIVNEIIGRGDRVVSEWSRLWMPVGNAQRTFRLQALN